MKFHVPTDFVFYHPCQGLKRKIKIFKGVVSYNPFFSLFPSVFVSDPSLQHPAFPFSP